MGPGPRGPAYWTALGSRFDEATPGDPSSAAEAPNPPPELGRLVCRYITAHRGLPWKGNQLLQHVEWTWPKVSDDPADATSNVTERRIGLTLKIRAKTMRGFRSDAKVLAHPHLASLLGGENGVCDMRKLI